MKNFIIYIHIILSFITNSQCTPDRIYADSTWGVWNVGDGNFISGSKDHIEQVVNFKFLMDAGDLDSAAAGTFIDSIVLTSISSYPNFLTNVIIYYVRGDMTH